MGFRIATSIEGTLTGRGGDIIIIDDPMKPIDALSDIKRERVHNAFVNTILSRLDHKLTGAIIIVMQRLHGGRSGRPIAAGSAGGVERAQPASDRRTRGKD
jgi:hypothetical protein